MRQSHKTIFKKKEGRHLVKNRQGIKMKKQNLTSTQEQLLAAISVPADNAEVQAVRDFLKENLHDVTVADSKRGSGCPVQDSIASCYRELSGLELRVAFNFGLVGNNNRRGRIIANVMRQLHGNEVEEVASVSTRTDSRRWWKMYENWMQLHARFNGV